jgi:hypothetical protein
MRLTSTGLGIGTSSPTEKLDVRSSSNAIGNFQSSNASGYAGINAFNGSRSWYAGIRADASNSFGIRDETAGATRLLIDSSGNLGLGVTPSAWGGSIKALEGYSTSGSWSIASGGGLGSALNIQSNAYYDGSNWIYKSTNPAANYYQSAGSHNWRNAASGTAGNAITFTDAMTLNASGNLLVGTTSSAGRTTVNGSTADNTANCISFRDSSSTSLFVLRNDGRISTGGTLSPYNNTTGSGANMFVDASGIFYRSTSSLKYKNNVQNATHGLAEVMNLRPVTYKGNNDGETIFGGLIAEEVHEAGLTEFVQYAEDGSPDALAYGNMVSLAFKAIQEQQALIQSLKARLDAANL